MSARPVQKLEHRSEGLVRNDFLHMALSLTPETRYLATPGQVGVSVR